MKVRIVEKVDFDVICAPRAIFEVQKRFWGIWFKMKSFNNIEGAMHFVTALQTKSKFEKVISEYDIDV